jgi:GTP-binding protein Era
MIYKDKAGYVTLIGLPNSGKSTFMNTILDIKLSIISAKPQTTRRRILGILNKPSLQAIFLDTPGIIEPKYNLQKKMMHSMQTSIEDADLLILIVDACQKMHPVKIDLPTLNNKNIPCILLLNKIDLIDKKRLLPLIDSYSKWYDFISIIPISALKTDGLKEVEKAIFEALPDHPPYYPDDILSEHPQRFFVAELIREQIFHRFQQEIPYSTEVQIEEFKERAGGKDFISATIFVERKSQKGIIIGQKGAAIKQISSSARNDIEAFLGRDVFLQLNVKVNENWRKDDKKLKRLGYP